MIYAFRICDNLKFSYWESFHTEVRNLACQFLHSTAAFLKFEDRNRRNKYSKFRYTQKEFIKRMNYELDRYLGYDENMYNRWHGIDQFSELGAVRK